jgi:DNA invertase Pin-like site-specific DNA recombinase
MPIPAAQYLRMSTEHQQYSLGNQSIAIAEYADRHGFAVVQTYRDAGKSGISLKRRNGLTSLLRDVIGGETAYKAILVYDVSRWGRFQDPDEAAHYEFICKNAGIPVNYCAESFDAATGVTSSVLKALKRSMAAEFSRQRSVRVFNLPV